MSEKIPDGWVKTTLGEICLSVDTIRPEDTPDMEFIYFEIGNIDNEYNRIAEEKIITGRNAPSRARQLVRKDDILFSTVRTYLRKIARVESDHPNMIASTGFTVIRPAQSVSSQFLFYQILSEEFLKPLHALQSGSSYPAVRSRDVFSQQIILPPVEEQNRIVAKLNTAFLKIEKGEKAASRALQRLQRYQASVLHSAINGDLTREWREKNWKNGKNFQETGENLLKHLLVKRRKCWEEDELKRRVVSGRIPKNNKWKSHYIEPKHPDIENNVELPIGWTWASLDQLCIVVRGASPRPAGDPRFFGGKIPWITVGTLTRDTLPYLTSTSDSLTEAGKEASRFIDAETLLLTNSGGTLGVPKISKIAGCINDGVAALLYIDYPLKLFLYYFLSYQTKRLRNINQGAAQPNLNTNIIKSIIVPLPPTAEQSEIIRKIEYRLSAANKLKATLERQLSRSQKTRQSLLNEAFSGQLVAQLKSGESASKLLEQIQLQKNRLNKKRKRSIRRHKSIKQKGSDSMHSQNIATESLSIAWEKIDQVTDARRLFDEAGFTSENVEQFYETLRATPTVLSAFQKEIKRKKQLQAHTKPKIEQQKIPKGRFRLIELWLEDFKNLKDYSIYFDASFGLNIILGWNGTGKSNLFEALVVIFRDLYEWREKNRWPQKPMKGYRIRYEINNHLVEVTWHEKSMKRPKLKIGTIAQNQNQETSFKTIRRENIPLPRFIFGYYSGPTNRLAEHFVSMKQAHYERLRDSEIDDTETLSELLEQRKFFCAENHHSKYVLLAFSYKDDPKISEFLKDRLRILGFESALFVIRKPRWAKGGSKSTNFWGARGIMRRVMERLRRHAIAPMVINQTVNYGYRSTKEDHYYFFLPDLESLHTFAAEYQDARTFFLALESTDFSELIYDVKIQVKVRTTNSDNESITFQQLSEGEQQLLMVFGLMRFTQSHQSLVLLDEPDTHLNPHWSVNYLKDLSRVMSENTAESKIQQSSQILMATHDPLVIASLVKEQIHLLKRDIELLKCYWEQPLEDPRGLGFTGILTSEMFGFRSDLDEETLSLLDKQVNLAGKEALTVDEVKDLERITQEVESLGFKSASSDPYYRAFIKAIIRRQDVRKMLLKQTITKHDMAYLKKETDEILAEIEEEDKKI